MTCIALALAMAPAAMGQCPNPGQTTAGIFRQGFLWILDTNCNYVEDSADSVFAFGGISGDIPITGDWTGNGTTKVGILRTVDGYFFFLDANGNGILDAGDRQFFLLGMPSNVTPGSGIPVVGDWNGDGKAKVGIFLNGAWYVDSTGTPDANGNHWVTATYSYGNPGDVPVVGKWNGGTGSSLMGIVRDGYLWVLNTSATNSWNSGDTAFAFGGVTTPYPDIPVVGNWTGSSTGASEAGVFRQEFLWYLNNGIQPFAYGGVTSPALDVPVVGDWGPFTQGYPDNPATVTPASPNGSSVQITFTYYDHQNGASDIADGNIQIMNGATPVCSYNWARNYGQAPIWTPNNTTGCTATLVSLQDALTNPATISDPSVVYVTINLTAGTGITGQFGIQTQTFDVAQAYSSSIETVGTWTVAAPFALTISSPQWLPAGGTASFTITAASSVPNQPIALNWLNPNNNLLGFGCQGIATLIQIGPDLPSTVMTGGSGVVATISTPSSSSMYNPSSSPIFICNFEVTGSYGGLNATPQWGQMNLAAALVYSFPPPASQTVLAGNSVYFPLTVTSSNGFAGTVAFSGTVTSSCGISVTPVSVYLPSNGSANPSLYVSVPTGCAAQNYTVAISTSSSSGSANYPSQNATLTVQPAVTVTPLPAATSMIVDGGTYYSATSFPVGSHTLSSASSATRSGGSMAFSYFDGANRYQSAAPPLQTGSPNGSCQWGCSGGQCSTPLPPTPSPAPTNVRITGVLQSGGTSTITITGNNFGPVAGALGFCPWGASPCQVIPTDGTPMSYSYTSWSDTQIVANVTLPSTVTEADWGVYVISDAWILGADAENPDAVEVPVAPGQPFITVTTWTNDNPLGPPAATLNPNNPIVYGGSQQSTSDGLTLTVVQPEPGVTYTWSVTGPGASAYTPPAPFTYASLTVPVWAIQRILPTAGILAFSVTAQYAGEPDTSSSTAQVEVGIRTDDVIIVGWINPAGVPSPDPTQVTAFSVLNGMLPTGGGNAGYCNAEVGALSQNGVLDPISGIPLTNGDRTYILDWMFKFSGNSDPALIPGGAFLDATRTAADPNKVSAFTNATTGYKLVNRFQVKMRITTPLGGEPYFTVSPAVLQGQNVQLIGTTPNPCGATAGFLGFFPGQSGARNAYQRQAATGGAQYNNSIYAINDGSPDSNAVEAFNTLVGGDGTAAPAFWEDIGTRIAFSATGGTSPALNFQPYPTYYLYINGSLANTVPQASSPINEFVSGNSSGMLGPYPFGMVSCTLPLGYVPGGRCGQAAPPPVPTARIPLTFCITGTNGSCN